MVAWAGALLAAGVSVAVNVGDAWPQGWGFVAFSATLPLLMLISAEQMARRLLGAVTVPVLLGVGGCAYSLSFWHTFLLLTQSWHEPGPLGVTAAVAVDGLAVGSVWALYRAGPGRSMVQPVAREVVQAPVHEVVQPVVHLVDQPVDHPDGPAQLSPAAQRVLAAVQDGEPVSKRVILDRTGITSRTTATRACQELVEAGLLRTEGDERAPRYQLAEGVAS